MEASGTIGKAWETIQARIQSETDMNEWLERFFPETSPVMKFKTRVPCDITLKKGEKAWAFDGKIDLKKVSLETDTLTVAPFKIQGETVFHALLKPGKEFRISDLKCDMGASSLRLKGLMDLQNDDSIQFEASSNRVVLEDLGIRFKKRNLPAGGNLGFDVSVKVSPSKPMETTVQGAMTGNSLSFDSAVPPAGQQLQPECCLFRKKSPHRNTSSEYGQNGISDKRNPPGVGWPVRESDRPNGLSLSFQSDTGRLARLLNRVSSPPGRTGPVEETGSTKYERVSEPVSIFPPKHRIRLFFKKKTGNLPPFAIQTKRHRIPA